MSARVPSADHALIGDLNARRGNTPQAFSLVGLVDAALRLSQDSPTTTAGPAPEGSRC